MNIETKKRLEAIEEELMYCEKIMERLKEERDYILHKQFKKGTELFEQIPTTVRNRLLVLGVKNDYDLIHYIDGDFESNQSWTDSCFKEYEKATTRKERLMVLKSVGSIYADKTIEILKNNGF